MTRSLTALVALVLGCTHTGSASPESPAPATESDPATPQSNGPSAERDPADAAPPCSEAWFTRVARHFPVADEQGHGPDQGSAEWMRALEHQQGLHAQDLPETGSDAWCAEVDRLLFAD